MSTKPNRPPPPLPSPDEVQHILYEIRSFYWCALLRAGDGHLPPQVVKAHLTEAACIHWRCLMDFFSGKKEKSDDIAIRDFRGLGKWTRKLSRKKPSPCDPLGQYDEINKKIGHPSRLRKAGAANNKWPLLRAAHGFLPYCREFLDYVAQVATPRAITTTRDVLDLFCKSACEPDGALLPQAVTHNQIPSKVGESLWGHPLLQEDPSASGGEG